MKGFSYAYSCPRCSSASIDRSVIFGGGASCRSCGWHGSEVELTATAVTSNASDETMLMAMCRDVANTVVSDTALSMGRLLTRWGFLNKDDPNMHKQLSKYMQNIAKATSLAIITTREEIELSKKDG